MATDIGNLFEKQVEKVFRKLKATHAVSLHRLVDSGSAGNIVQSQPSDYLLGVPGSLGYLEAKASEKHKKLQLSMLRPSQRGAIKYYQGVLRIPYYVLFWDVVGSRIELWEGLTALKSSRTKKPLTVLNNCSFREKLNEEALREFLIGQFNLRPLKELNLEFLQ